MNVTIGVDGQKLRIPSNLRKYIEGTENFIKFTFNLSSDWENLTVKARFVQGERDNIQELDDTNSVYLPKGVQAGKCGLYLLGESADKSVKAVSEHITLLIGETLILGEGSSETTSFASILESKADKDYVDDNFLKNEGNQTLTDGTFVIDDTKNQSIGYRVKRTYQENGETFENIATFQINGDGDTVVYKQDKNSVENQMLMSNDRTDFTEDVYIKNNKVATETYVDDAVNTINNTLEGKQDTLSADNTIAINNNEIGVNTNVIATKNYVKSSVIKAGHGITTEENTSADGNTENNGTYFKIDQSVVATHIDLQKKQDVLQAGNGVRIQNESDDDGKEKLVISINDADFDKFVTHEELTNVQLGNFVRCDGYQDLTTEQKAQARWNIGAVSSSELSTGLSDKATFEYVNNHLSSKLTRMFFDDLEQAINYIDATSDEVDFEAIIYMIPNGKTDGDNIYNEYMWRDGNFELIGSTAVDLSGYQKKLVAGSGISLEEDNIGVKITGGGLKFLENGSIGVKCDTRQNTLMVAGGNAELAVNTDVIATKEDLNGSNLAGLYDESNNLIMTWAEIKETYPDAFKTKGNILPTGQQSYFKSLEGSLILGYDINVIGDYAFRGCTSLTSITIPNSVTSIGKYVFRDCTSLTSVTIPDNVTSIGDFAFYNCTSLTSTIIGNSVTSIGTAAFQSCSSLASITIPSSVVSINAGVFLNCSLLTDVYYEGSEEDWNNITIGKNNPNLLSDVIHYNQSIATKDYVNSIADNKQDTLIAGDGIDITDNIISVNANSVATDYDLHYYSTISKAATDFTNQSLTNADSDKDNAEVCMWLDDNNCYNVMLLKDITLEKCIFGNEIIQFTTSLNLNLNGKTFNGRLELYNTSYIDGTKTGSKITQTITDTLKAKPLIHSYNLTINGGMYEANYNLSETNSQSVELFQRTWSAGGGYPPINLNISNATCSLITNVKESGIARSNNLKLNNCTFNITSTSAETLIGINHTKEGYIKNCTFTVTSEKATVLNVIQNNADANLLIEDSNINLRANICKSSYGLFNDGIATLNNVNIHAESPNNANDSGEDFDKIANAVYNSLNGVLTINNGKYVGMHTAISSKGNIFVDGGTYLSCSHGGFYLGGNVDKQIYIKNASIGSALYDSGEYYVYYPDTKLSNDHPLGTLYIGGSQDTGSNISVHIDNCTLIEVPEQGESIVFRKGTYEHDNKLYISNTILPSNKKLRNSETNNLYIGLGTNITKDKLSNPNLNNYSYTEIDGYVNNYIIPELDNKQNKLTAGTGIIINDTTNTISIDTSVIGSDSNNPSQGGSSVDLSAYQLKSAIKQTFDSTLNPNTDYYLGNISTDTTLAFPSTAEIGDTIYINFNCASAFALTIDMTYTSDIDIDIEAGVSYEIFANWNGSVWILGYNEYTVS